MKMGSEYSYARLSYGWQMLAARTRISRGAQVWHHRLIAAWTESQRQYHTLEHLEECLGPPDEVAVHCANATAMELAIWFRDAVYDPTSGNLEAPRERFERFEHDVRRE